MKKYKCRYDHYAIRGIPAETILATSPREAYEKFIEKVGADDEIVYVETGMLTAEKFEDHLSEKTNDTVAPDETKNLAEIKSAENTDKLLARLIEIQQFQFSELKKLNFKLMMFWIILVIIPIVLSMMQ